MAQTELTVFVDETAISDDLVRYIADVGAPNVVSVGAKQTLASIVTAECGRLSEAYLQAIEQANPAGAPPPESYDYVFEKPGEITLPACLKPPSREPAPVSNGATPGYSTESGNIINAETYWTGNDQIYDASGYQNIMSWNDPSILFPDQTGLPHPMGSGGDHTAYMGLEYWTPKKGSEWPSPDQSDRKPTSGWATVTLKPEKVAFADAADTVVRKLIEGGQDPEETAVENPEEIRLFSDLSNARLASTNSCQHPETVDHAVYPFDPLEVLQVLSESKSALEQASKRPIQAVIVVADTGLYADGRTPFHNRRLSRGNASQGDFYRDIKPHEFDPHQQHGTNVASTALGGAAFMRLIDTLGLDLLLRPVRIYRPNKIENCSSDAANKCTRFRVGTGALSAAVTLVDNAIVNLSIGRSGRYDIFDKYELGRSAGRLFVVAAGNDSSSLADRAVYPAQYGGSNEGQYNLVTVAATDYDGSLTGFSNWSNESVDIAAYGCRLPVLEYSNASESYHRGEASGTSLAAPLVSFTAGLIKTIWPTATPEAIKRRLLVSADIDDRLLNGVEIDGAKHKQRLIKDGRRLNIAKALSLYQDVVEVEVDGARRTIRGAISADAQVFTVCNPVLTLYRGPKKSQSQIRKIARIKSEDPPVDGFLIDYTNRDGLLKSKRCTVGSFSLTITDNFLRETSTISSDQIVDVVFAESAL